MDCASSSVCFSASGVPTSGLGAPGADDHAVADAGDIDGGAGDEAGLGGGVLENIDRHHREVERRAEVACLIRLGVESK